MFCVLIKNFPIELIISFSPSQDRNPLLRTSARKALDSHYLCSIVLPGINCDYYYIIVGRTAR